MIYGYVRVSSKKQCEDRQLVSMDNYHDNIDKVFIEKQSGKNFDRPVYQEMKNVLRQGDEVVVHALDRLGRNKLEMKQEIEWFKEHGITLRVLNVPTTLIDFQGQEWIGDMINNILCEVLASVAENERNEMIVRVKEGLAAKKARGDWDNMGRPFKATPDFEKFLKKQKDGKMTVKECCTALGISRRTWYNRLAGTY